MIKKWFIRWMLRLIIAFMLITVIPVLLFRWLPPPTSSVMLQRMLTEGATQAYQWIPFDQISAELALAVVAAEDQKFPYHWGFDFKAMIEAVKQKAGGGRLRGASTLTQQVARNLFLWQGRSYLRKGLEAWFTLLLELLWSKQRIIEVYLNIAEMGERIFGAESASRNFFGRSAGKITQQQAALLAAVLPSPTRYRADFPSSYVLERQQWILRQMQQLGGVKYLQNSRQE